MIGKTILHYKILEKLGEGGMGVVYKAEDTKLKRDVAIKFLPRQIAASDEERERFRIEAQAAAALNHPNIATIHAIEEHDDETRQEPGTLFIVMEFIEGRELKEAIGSGPLAVGRALEIATQIAAGLQAAHEKGVVHRDVKSSNIMITESGQVKIMDFGLAKVHGGAQVTKIGTTLGTAAYMSPEQAQGLETDHRTDIWAFGVVLYEMLTGELPFKGDYEQAVIYAILNEEPEPTTALRSGVPMELERIVNKALAKTPDERYQHVTDMIVDLSAVAQEAGTGISKTTKASVSGEVAVRRRGISYGIAAALLFTAAIALWQLLPFDDQTHDSSIAVLPFQDLNVQAGNAYFSDGITEDIITQISKIGALTVISRASVMRYKSSNKTLSEIAGELRVGHLLQGSIRQQGERVRISAQLIEARREQVIWAEAFDRKLKNIFGIQSEVAQQIAKALQAELSPAEKTRLAKKPTDNLQAYKLYLQGKFHWNRRTQSDLQQAIEFFEQAVALDSTYALGYAGLAQTYVVIGSNGLAPPDSVYPKAERYCRKALSLDYELPEAHATLGAIQHEYYWDYAGSEAALRKAMQLNPSYATAHQWLAEGYVQTRRYDLAEQEIKIAISLDPHSPIIKHVQGQIYLAQRMYDETITLQKKILSENPDILVSRIQLISAYMGKQDYDNALAENEKIQSEVIKVGGRARIYAKRGDLTKAKAELQVLLEMSETSFVFPSTIALIYSDLGDTDEAFYWFERALEVRDPVLLLLNLYPPGQSVLDDPRFLELLRKVGVIG